MLQKSKTKIVGLFFEEPSRYFQIRQIARLTKIAHTSVKNHLEALRKEGLVKKVKTTVFYSYIANQESKKFKTYKQIHMLLKIQDSGLIDYLEEEFHPVCIILFGSVRKGEYVKSSDIDLFIQTKKESLDLTKFEKKLNHKINLFFEQHIHKISKELINNVVNGIKLSGYLKLK